VNKKKVLITGGLGFVGGRLARQLSPVYEVYVTSRRQTTADVLKLHGIAGCLPHDLLLNASSFPDEVDIVIHLAALNEIDCVKHPSEAIDVNVNQSRIILEHAIKKQVSRFIYFSTVHVYGSPLRGNIDEDALTRPTHPYSITHRAAEDYVNSAHDKGQIEGLIVRLSNSFGAPVLPDVNRWTLLVNDLCRQAATSRQLKLLSNGCQYRDFITLSDVEQAVLHLVSAPLRGENIINLSAAKSLTVLEMAKLVADCYYQMEGNEIPVLLPED
jgi:UDP-glucose 4-epimerase